MPEKKVLITFNARNENDQQLFCRDLAESIAESNEMEQLRIKTELDKFKPNNTIRKKINMSQITTHLNTDKNDSTITSSKTKTTKSSSNKDSKHDNETVNKSSSFMAPPQNMPTPKLSSNTFNRLHKRTLSNSLLDLNINCSNQNSPSSKNLLNRNTTQPITLHRTGSECSLMTSNTAF